MDRSIMSTLEDVKRAIAALPRDERAALQPWFQARYDFRGYALENGRRLFDDSSEEMEIPRLRR